MQLEGAEDLFRRSRRPFDVGIDALGQEFDQVHLEPMGVGGSALHPGLVGDHAHAQGPASNPLERALDVPREPARCGGRQQRHACAQSDDHGLRPVRLHRPPGRSLGTVLAGHTV